MTPFEPADDPLVGGVERPLAAVAVAVLEMDLLATRAVEHEFLLLLEQVLPRGVHRKVTEVGHGPLHPLEVLASGTGPRCQRSV
jgi:hypothetical protein